MPLRLRNLLGQRFRDLLLQFDIAIKNNIRILFESRFASEETSAATWATVTVDRYPSKVWQRPWPC